MSYLQRDPETLIPVSTHLTNPMTECVKFLVIDISRHDTLTSKLKRAHVIDKPTVRNKASIWTSWKRTQQQNLAVTLTKHEIKEYGDDFFEIVREREREVSRVEISSVHPY